MQIEKIDTFSGHRGPVYALEGGISPEIIFSGASDGMLVQWNLNNPDVGKGVAQFAKGIFAIKYVAKTNQIWIATHLDGIHVIDLGTSQEVFTWPMPAYSIFSFELVGNLLFAGNSGGFINVFDVILNKHLHSFQFNNSSVRKIANLGSEQLLIAGADGQVRITDWEGRLIASTQAHQQTVFSLAFSKKQNLLITVGKDAKVKKWKLENAQINLIEELVGHIFPIHDVLINSSENLFATSSMDKTIKIWDTQQFKLLKVIDFGRHGGHKNSVNKLYWTDYQDLLVSASDDKNISVWKLNS
jgi:WD40 repeat protein